MDVCLACLGGMEEGVAFEGGWGGLDADRLEGLLLLLLPLFFCRQLFKLSHGGVD